MQTTFLCKSRANLLKNSKKSEKKNISAYLTYIQIFMVKFILQNFIKSMFFSNFLKLFLVDLHKVYIKTWFSFDMFLVSYLILQKLSDTFLIYPLCSGFQPKFQTALQTGSWKQRPGRLKERLRLQYVPNMR